MNGGNGGRAEGFDGRVVLIGAESERPYERPPLTKGFLLGKERYDGGERKFSTTRLETVGKAVAGVLKNAEETKNRVVFVHEAVVTQNQLAALSGKKWEAEVWICVPVGAMPA